ncbi:hypothetical protein BC628DRAFT_341940 [Trametes gibbosa]|nr:hypothetical protein BC628DRAFT_341940 [Trametes gibbosa]
MSVCHLLAMSWKIVHKKSCRPHPALFENNGTPKTEPMDIASWAEVEVDKQLSRWLERWRKVFSMYAVICLDLANHSPERVATHCLVIRARYKMLPMERYWKYSAVSVKVEPRGYIEGLFPDLGPIVTDPMDLQRACFVLILENPDGSMLRVRAINWNDVTIPTWRGLPKQASCGLAQEGTQLLVHAVNNEDPEWLLRLLRGN